MTHPLVALAEPEDGFFVLRGLYTNSELDAMADLVRALKSEAPFAQPTMRDGTPLRVKVTSWGSKGWWADQRGYRYIDAHPNTGKRWPDLPTELRMWAFRAFFAASMACKPWQPEAWGFRGAVSADYPDMLDTCLVNLYDRGASLGWHVDETERSLLPITTISLGEPATFEIELSRGVVSTTVYSGDAVIMAGASRRARHRVAGLVAADLFTKAHNPLRAGIRLSLTLRCTGLP